MPIEVYFVLWGWSSALYGVCGLGVLITAGSASPHRHRADWYAVVMVLAAIVALLVAHPADSREVSTAGTPLLILPLAIVIALLHRFREPFIRGICYGAFGLLFLCAGWSTAIFTFAAIFWAIFNFPPGSHWDGTIG